MEYLYEGLCKVIEDRGMSVLCDKYLANMMADYQVGKEIPAYDVILKKLQSHGYMSEILNYYNQSEKNTIISKLQFYASVLSTESALKRSSVSYVLECIAYSLGLVNKPIASSIKRCKFNPLGHWQFNFSPNKIKLLIIKADGTAVSESKTIYHWEISNDEIKIFIPNAISYDGWFIDADTIEGNANSLVYNRSWRWFAKRSEYSLALNNLFKGKWVIENKQVDLENNIITFDENRTLHSELYNDGSWHLEDDILTVITANNFIRYEFHSNMNHIDGVATNNAGITWKSELKKLKEE